MIRARSIAIVATLATSLCVAAIVPVLAFGTDGSEPAVDPSVAAQLDVRESVEALNADAVAQAPAAVGSHCGATLDVTGIGDACVTPDGLIRVEQADGRSHTIHGLDAPPVGAASYPPASQAAVEGAGPSSIACVDADESRYVLVYARPSGTADRFTTVAPKLRTAAYRVSAFIDAESRAVDPDAGQRLPLQCTAGTPTVLNVAIGGAPASGASFQQVVDGLIAAGYEFNGSGSNRTRYLVYFDAPSSSGAAGTGHVFTADSSAAETNANNRGGLYAIEYRYADGGGLPHWEVLVHELMHTMGAVVDTAPHSSGHLAGHCNDGLDVMCYADGGSNSHYDTGVCATTTLDCGRDDYFNPAPAADSYLAANWNAAATYNRWLVHGITADTSAPSEPASLRVTGTSRSSAGLTWGASSDDRGVAGYDVSYRTGDGAWQSATTTSRTSVTVTGLSELTAYEFAVTARDSAGNASTAASASASTTDQDDLAAPARPAAFVARVAGRSVTFTWRPTTDDIGVAEYELRRVTTTPSNRRALRSAGRTPETKLTIPTTGLRAGAAYQFELVAYDAAGNVSSAARRTVKIGRDRTRPSAPGRLTATQRTGSAITLSWTASRDDVAVTQYLLYQRVGARWQRLGSAPLTATTVIVNRLRAGTTYTFRVVAADAAGNRSTPSRALDARTTS